MSYFLPTGKDTWKIKFPSQTGGWITRTAGTTSKSVARAIHTMVEALGPQEVRAWDLLQLVETGTLSLPALYDAYQQSKRDVAALRQLLTQHDLVTLLSDYQQHCESSLRRLSHESQRRHVRAAHSFVGASLLPSNATEVYCRRWLSRIAVGRQAGTVRPLVQGARDFCEYAKQHGYLATNPWLGITLPPPAAPRINFLEDDERDLLLSRLPEPHRTLAILALATAADLSSALLVSGRDFDASRKAVRIPGTKAHARDRQCLIDLWAWPLLEPAVLALAPGQRMVSGTDRWRASDVHRATTAALAQEGHQWADGYWFRDHRHTWAVRAVRAGMPLELVARQLGHVNALLVLKVYGRFRPTSQEADSWRETIELAAQRRRPTRTEG